MAAADDTSVLTERRGFVTLLTLNRAAQRNTITNAMLVGLAELLRAAEDDPGTRAVVITGAGRTFCAGLDLGDAVSDEGIKRGGFALAPELDTSTFPPCVLMTMDTPVVCALNGAAAGFGMDLALCCDIRVAAPGAKMAAAFVKRGVVPESGGTWWLPRLLGWSRAADVVFRGRTLDAQACLAAGLVDEIAEDACAGALAVADEIAENAPLAVQSAKRMMRTGLAEAFEEHVQRVYREALPLLDTEDFQEGVRSFLEKRAPTFRGR